MDSDDNSRNNPYVTEGLEQPINESITPNFNPEASHEGSDNHANDRNNAVKFLRGAEDSATNDASGKNPSDSPTQTADKFENKVTGKKSDGQSKNPAKLSGKGKNFKKAAPVITIFAAILGFGGLLLGSQASLPFALVSRLVDEFNSLSVSNSHRSKSLLRTIQQKMRAGEISKTDTTVQQLETGLAQQGGTLSDNGDITLTDSDGKKTTITSDGSESTDADGTRRTSLDTVENSGIFSTVKNKLYGAMSTWRGNISGFFTKTGNNIKKRIGWVLDRWHDWTNTGDSGRVKTDADGNIDEKTKKFKDTAADPDGDPKTKIDSSTDTISEESTEEGENRTTSSKESSSTESSDDIDSTKKSLGESVNDVASQVQGLACAASDMATALSNIVIAAQITDTINIASGLFEAVNKTQMGEGSSAPISEYMTSLTQTDSDQKSAMSSYGIGALFGSKASPGGNTDNTAAKANREGAINKLFGVQDKNSYLGCRSADALTSGASIVLAFLTAGGSTLVQKGVAAFKAGFLSLVEGGKKTIASIGLSLAINLFGDDALNWLAGVIVAEGAKQIFGPEYGEYIASGGTTILNKVHFGHGGSGGSADAVFAFKQEQEAVLAETAEYERSIRSPFDTSSSYTFLGSIIYTLAPYASMFTGSSASSLLSTSTSILSESIASLVPNASAKAASEVVTTQGDCAQLSSVGAIGDMYCNPYTISDSSTLDVDITEIINNILAHGGFEETDANEIATNIAKGKAPTIKKSSNLAKYKLYCGERGSNLGAIDGEISSAAAVIDSGVSKSLDALDSSQTLSSIATTAIDVLPLIGDVKDIIDSMNQAANIDWVSGQACVDTSGNSHWGEYKWYQAYLEYISVQESLVETPDTAYNSDGTLALSMFYDPMTDEEYETWLAERKAEKSDPDYEYKQIAKYSGYSVAEVKELMNTLTEFIDQQNYDPTNLAPIVTAVKPDGKDQPRNIIEIEAPLIDDSDAINAQSLALATKEKYLLYKQTLATTTA